jgi:hypothetical protein
LVWVLSVHVIEVPQHEVKIVGGSKLQLLPHSTILFVGQATVSAGAGTGGLTVKGTVQE